MVNKQESREWWSGRKDWLVAGLLGIWFGVIEWWKPYFFLTDDNAKYFLPAYVHNTRVLTEFGRLALVNMYQFMGADHLSVGQTGVFYPPVYLVVWLSKTWLGHEYGAIDLLVIGHLIMAGVGMRKLLFTLKIREAPAIGGGLMWATLVFVVAASRSWVFVSYMVCYMTWSYLLLIMLKEKGDGKKWLGYVVVKTLLFFSGYVQFFVMLTLSEIMFVGLSLKRRRRLVEYVKEFLLANLLVTASVLPLLLPLWQAIEISDVRSAPMFRDFFVQQSVDLWSFLLAQVGDFGGKSIFETTSAIYYVGVVPFLLVIASVVREIRRKSLTGWWRRWRIELMALIALLASTELYGLVYIVPGLNRFRWPFKYLVIFYFFLVISFVLRLSGWTGKKQTWGNWVMIAVISMSGWVLMTQERGLKFSEFTYKQVPNELNQGFDSNYRVMGYRIEDINLDFGGLTYNTATLLKVNHVGGYEPLVSANTSKLTFGLNYLNTYGGQFDQRVVEELGDRSIRYLITERGTDGDVGLASGDLVKLVNDSGSGVRVFEIEGAQPIVSWRTDVGEVGVELHEGANSVWVDKPVNEEGVLVVRVNPERKWKIRFDGNTVKTDLGGSFPLLISVPEGISQVEIAAVNLEFERGALISGLVWAGIGVGWWGKKRRVPDLRRRK